MFEALLHAPTASGGAISISFVQMSFSILLVLLVAGVSLSQSLKLERPLVWGTLRTVLQLSLMGFVLRLVFALQSPWLVALLFVAMTTFAADIVRGRVKKQPVRYFLPTLLTMQTVFFVVTWYVSGVIVGATPWWSPQYFVPIGGMIAGNSMNALAISLERLFSGLRSTREAYEMRLLLGATPEEASADVFRDALRAGMIPSINGLMGAGLVSIPGMMTGQILSGADPAEASRYQIVVMLMITTATALASFIALKVIRRRCFAPCGKLLLD